MDERDRLKPGNRVLKQDPTFLSVTEVFDEILYQLHEGDNKKEAKMLNHMSRKH